MLVRALLAALSALAPRETLPELQAPAPTFYQLVSLGGTTQRGMLRDSSLTCGRVLVSSTYGLAPVNKSWYRHAYFAHPCNPERRSTEEERGVLRMDGDRFTLIAVKGV